MHSDPKMVEASQSEKINIISYAEVEKVSGFVGNFTATIRKKARYIDETKCTGCGLCTTKCPSRKGKNEFNMNLDNRGAVYIPFAQAIPNVAVIDPEQCIKLKTGKCGLCEKVCTAGAINYKQQDEIIEREYGAIVVATGFQVMDVSKLGEFGYAENPDVVTSLEFERLMNAAGPTGGTLLRPSDGKHPKTLVFIQCVGSRCEQNDERGKPYCSKICCMYTAKHAMLVREKYPDTDVHVFYIDVRTPGKNFDEFYRRAAEQYGVDYIKGMVGKVAREGDKLMVQGSDLINNQQLHIAADMVVLAAAIEPDPTARSIGTMLTASMDTNDFFTEAHPKLRPVESPTAGVFLSGMAQGPKDIPETVAQAGAAASKVIGLLAKDHLVTNPCIASSNELMCNGCSQCERSAPTARSHMLKRKCAVPACARCAGWRRSIPRYVRAAARAPSLSLRRDGPQGLQQQADYGGGGRDMLVTSNEWKPRIVAFCCNWCSYAGADLAGSGRLSYPADIKIIRVPCSCRVNPMFILRAFERGADGVILCGCHPGDCHYTSGNYYARRRMTMLFSMLDYLGIERERTRVEWVSAAEGAKFAKTMNEFAETITKLGENRRLGDLRCKK